MAVKFAKSVGAIVTVLSSSESKRERALAMGASGYVNYRDENELKTIEKSLDVIIDTCPFANPLESLMDVLVFGGTYVRVGIPSTRSSSFSYDFISLIDTGRKICGSIVSGSKHTLMMVEVAAANGIVSEVEVVPFSSLCDVMSKLERGENASFRYVLSW